MKSNYLILFFFLLYINVNSQFYNSSIYSLGKIITKTDTITCYIESCENYSGFIKYQLTKDDKNVVKINVNDVEHLKIPPRDFDKITIDSKNNYLMEKLCEGEISFYKHTYSNKVQIDNGATVNSSSVDVAYYIVKGSVVFKINKKDFKEKLKRCMSDYEEIYSKIDQLDYNDLFFHSNLKGIISKYNFRHKFK